MNAFVIVLAAQALAGAPAGATGYERMPAHIHHRECVHARHAPAHGEVRAGDPVRLDALTVATLDGGVGQDRPVLIVHAGTARIAVSARVRASAFAHARASAGLTHGPH